MDPRFWLSFCVVLTLAQTAAAQKLRPCHQNPCTNGGHCYRVGDYMENSFCDQGFAPYRGRCYNFIQNPRSWSDGQLHCQTIGADLVRIDSQGEREFIQSYLREQLSGQDLGSRDVNVWTAGRPEGEWGKITWVWKPQNEIIQPTFWATGQPEPQLDLTAALQNCVAVSSAAGFLNWVTDSCDLAENYYICEKAPATPEATDGQYLYQCDCREGYSGIHCEIEPEADQPVSPTNFYKCSSDDFNLSCDQISGWTPNTIRIDYAAYGMPSNYVPQHCSGIVNEVECVADNTLVYMIQRCQGLEKCSVPILKDTFANPCRPGSMNYLKYRYRCEIGQLQCPPGSDMYKGRCYQIVYESDRLKRNTWQNARNMCNAQGGDLVGPIDQDVHHFLSTRLRQLQPERVKYFWMGLRNFGNGNTWTGADSLGFLPKGSKYAENQTGCVAYMVKPSSENQPEQIVWLRKGCDIPYNWICQFSPFGFQRPRLTDPFWNRTTLAPQIYSPIPTPSSTATTARSTLSYVTDVVPNPTFARATTPTTTTTTASTTTSATTVTPMPSPSTTPLPSSKQTVLSTSYSVFSTPVTTTSTTDLPSTDKMPEVPGECPSITQNGLLWSSTPEGHIASTECPVGTIGVAFWFCTRVDGVVAFRPETPDLSDCRHLWVDELRSQVLGGEDSMLIGQELNKNLLETETLRGGDVTGTVQILDQLIPLAKTQLNAAPVSPPDRAKLATDFTQVIGASSDLLLSRMSAWDELRRSQRMQTVSSLMKNLEVAADMLSFYLGPNTKQESFAYDNFAMKVEVIPYKIDDDVTEKTPHNSSSLAPVRSPDITPDFGAAASSNAPDMTLPSASILRAALANTLYNERQGVAPSSVQSPLGDPVRVQKLRMGYFLFPALGEMLEPRNSKTVTTIVNSQVIGATINDPSVSVQLPPSQPVSFKFWHLQKENVNNPRCVYWNVEQSFWDTWGCNMKNSTQEFTVCECTHLTSFAILMDVDGNTLNLAGINKELLDWLTLIGCTLSSICLALCIIVFTVFRSLWNDRNTIHRNLCICLLLAELIFLFGIDRTEQQLACSIVAVALHYVLLAAFSWMLLEGYQLYVMLVQVFETESSRIWVYHLLAYGLPLGVVAVSAGVRWQDYGTSRYCWIDVSTDTIWAFVAPISLVILINILFLGLALKVVLSVQSHNNKTRHSKIKGWLKGSTMLLCLLGVTWAVGYFILVKEASVVFAYIFTVLNSLQGVFIFGFHVLLNDKVHTAVLRACRRGCACCSSDFSSTAFNSSDTNPMKKWVVNGSSSGGYSNSTNTTGTNPVTPLGHAPKADWSPTDSQEDTGARWRWSRVSTLPRDEKDDKLTPIANGTVVTVNVSGSTVDKQQLNHSHLCSKGCKDAHHIFNPVLNSDFPIRKEKERFVTNISTAKGSKGSISSENPVLVERF